MRLARFRWTAALAISLFTACSSSEDGGGIGAPGSGSDAGPPAPGLDGGGGGADGGDGVVVTHASGEPDLTFGTGGHVERTYRRTLEIHTMVIQPDGKILLGGGNTPPASAWRSALLLRLNADGSPDPTFGTNGEVMMNMGATTDAYVHGIMVAPDGKLLLGGYTTAHTTAGALTGFFYMQLLANGEPNTGFGTGGRTSFDVNGSHKNSLLEVRFFPDGTAAYMGISSGSSLYQYPSVSRVGPDGRRVPGYGVSGTIHTDPGNRYLHHVTFEKDGKLLLCYGNQQRGADLYLERYDAMGKLETSGAFKVLDPDGDHSRCHAVLAQDSGKIVVAGAGYACNTEPTCPGKHVLVRFNADLTVDTAFDVAASTAALTADGDNVGLDNHHVVGGDALPVAESHGADRLRVRRFTAVGAVDGVFNQNTGLKDLSLKQARRLTSGFAIEKSGRLTSWALVETATESFLVLDRFWL
jgi:uncharacterized delta-60 repeat protein